MLIFSGDNKLIDLPLELFHSLYPIFLSLTLSNSSFPGNPSRPTIHPCISPHTVPKRGLQIVMDITYITVHGIYCCCELSYTSLGIAALVSLASVSCAQRQTFSEYISHFFFSLFLSSLVSIYSACCLESCKLWYTTFHFGSCRGVYV